MAKRATSIALSPEVERTLREWVEDATRQQLVAQRAMIVLLAAEHKGTRQIARVLGIRPARVSKWRTRFATHGIAGLQTAERTGKPRSYDDAVEARILAQIEQMPPAPNLIWTGPLLADVIGNVSVDYVWRVLRAHHINLRRRDHETRSPVLRRLVTITGIYLNAATSAFLIAVAPRDKASTLDRLQTYVHVPNPDVAANLKNVSSAWDRPTLLQALQAAVVLAASAPGSVRDSRTIMEFLDDAASRLGPDRVCAFLTGTRISVPSEIHPHFINELETWRQLLRSALAISLEEAAGDPAVVQTILSSVDEFLSSQPPGRTATFEWRTWSVAPHIRSLHRTGAGQ